ncbi:error-prone DNA polymerase [Rhizosaccharibacter radicis]|uniref:Error-prone DNA polymerase n=1 Tax=Rhizosaccharibacter radicis TaxID=2782605 RepID=A0ABT1VYE4_9PROT|nr:error-prone DNA polymerase [Acetobacteraceae bacterium KSS12]
MRYLELQCCTDYSFLRGASHPHELFAQAAAYGYEALAVTDRNSLAGIVAAHRCARETGLRLVVGCRLDLLDAPSVLLFPENRQGYARLCALLSVGKERGGKGACLLDWSDLANDTDGLLAVMLPERPLSALADTLPPDLARLRAAFGDRCWCALTLERGPDDWERLHLTERLARAGDVPAVITGDVLYHHPQRRILQDVMSCIREGCTIDAIGFRRARSVDRHLKTPGEVERLFATRHPEALLATGDILRRARFSLNELRYQYPEESETPGLTDHQDLERLVREASDERYPGGVPEKVATQLRHELSLIRQLDYAPYFLTVNAIVREARRLGILCQGRGSAANSAVCFVLGITSIDPVEGNLLFERFISADRNEPPDIDVDFEHERREEIIQWIFKRYGRQRAALCAAVARYHSRGAVRDVGKALGLPDDVTAQLAGQIWGWSDEGVDLSHAQALGLNTEDRRLRLTLLIARELIGHPRHLSQHPGGFVLTRDRLDSLVPIEPAAMADRQVIEWDKDDIDELKFMKVDVLGLGMLGCMRRAFGLLEEHRGLRLDLADIPADDPDTFAMIQRADTLGTFQIESRAQMAMLPRLKPRKFYDLVVQVAIVRPGPIQGDMVHPYLRRREGLEEPEYPQESLYRVLHMTYGVPLFQEQAMQVAIQCAGFSPSEADQLRRSMATFKMTGGVARFKDKLVDGMERNGFTRAFAEKTFSQIEGFGSYGFPESHAAGFARIAYMSAWIKCHHPDVFCCALLNAQPMGFYAPAQVVRDAREHEVPIRPVCALRSEWDCTLEETGGRLLAVRLGLRMVSGLKRADADAILRHREPETAWLPGPDGLRRLQRRTGVFPSGLEPLAQADGFAAFGLTRREALWALRGLDEPLPLFAALEQGRKNGGSDAFPPARREPTPVLPPSTEGVEVAADYRSVGLSLRRHPLSLLRPVLHRRGLLRCDALLSAPDGKRLGVAGIVLVRQKPGSAKGVMFMTIEDEAHVANLVLWPSVFERHRRLVLSAGMVACHGRVQRAGEVVHLVVEALEDLTPLLRGLNRAPALRHALRDRDRGSAPIQVSTRDFR